MLNPEEILPQPEPTKPESLEESILEMLHLFDPTTALHELEALDELEHQPNPPDAEPGKIETPPQP
ncbi:hypothetical protein SAMN02745146_3194 [Hymenobacter daecheongensis DSM 21074]|uniref:Uncharacterized protein n=1 Tax=Hymenobacter daecheongensis DSM 21074 TaxID=1121955 RepID=A0A1M6JMQ3_9BACT|nr:hypothetical protein [Hymenobacter daecheongensis]SHJ47940.1 hypothetical protein SAMN02745146_3194 [Hymenobacter daecheongensis DSM 21074]